MRRVWWNTLMLVAADVLARGSTAVLFWLIARQLGASAAGAFSTGVAYMLVTSRLAFWGLDQLLIRDVSRLPEQMPKYVVNFLVVRFILSLAAVVMLIAVTELITLSSEARNVVRWMSLAAIPDNLSNISQAVFLAREKAWYWVAIGAVSGLLRLAFVGAGLSAGANTVALSLLFLLASLVGMLISIGVVVYRFTRLDWRLLDRSFWKVNLVTAFPFLFTGLFFTLDGQLNTLILSSQYADAQVGIYNGAAVFINTLSLLPQAFRSAFFPTLARGFSTGRGDWQPLFQRAIAVMLYLAFPITIGLVLTAPELIRQFYPSESFAEAVPVLRTMAWSLLFTFPGVVLNRLLIVDNRQKYVAVNLGLALLANLILAVVLIPSWTLVGASVARLASSFLFFALDLFLVSRVLVKPPLLRLAWRPALAALGMAIAVWPVRHMFLGVPVAVGGIVYAVLWLTMKSL